MHIHHFLGVSLALLLTPLTLSHLSAQAGGGGAVLYAVSFNDKQLLTVDPNTGAGTLVTNLGLVTPYDLAAYRGSLYLYRSSTANSQALAELDPFTGQIRRTMEFTNRITGGEGALDFDAEGWAVATKSTSQTGTVFRLDMATGALKLATPEGGLFPSLDGLAFDPQGVLYGLRQGGAALYIVNPFTGETTLVGNLGLTLSEPASVGGLAFAPDGVLYAALGGDTDSHLYRLSKATGVATWVGAIGFARVCGLRFFTPPPGPLLVRRAFPWLEVAWPHARGGILQTTDQLPGFWRDVERTVTTNGTEASVLVPWAGPRGFFRLSSGPSRTNGFAMIANATPQVGYVLLASTNLLQWVPLQTNEAATAQFGVADTNASGFPQRFYRLMVQP